MTEKELQKLIEKKGKELEQLQLEINKTKYCKHVGAIANPLCESNDVLSVIQSNGLNNEDCKFIGEKLAANFDAIYKEFFEKGVLEKQERRRRKSSARAERNARQRNVVQREEPSKEVERPAEQERAY